MLHVKPLLKTHFADYKAKTFSLFTFIARICIAPLQGGGLPIKQMNFIEASAKLDR